VGVPVTSVSVNLVGGSIIAEVELPAAAAAQLQQEFQQGKVTALGGFPIVSVTPVGSMPMQSSATASSGSSISIRLTGDLSYLDRGPLHRVIANAAGVPASKVAMTSFPDQHLEAEIDLPTNETSMIVGIVNELLGALPKPKPKS
jgi:hypothetical protein